MSLFLFKDTMGTNNIEQVMSPPSGGIFTTFSGSENDWGNWSFQFLVACTACGHDDVLEHKLKNQNLDMTAERKKSNALIHARLAVCCKGDALSIVKRATNGEGATAWKLLHDRYGNQNGSNQIILLNSLFSLQDKDCLGEGQEMDR